MRPKFVYPNFEELNGSKLGDVSVCKALFYDGRAAIDASTDPMILLAKRVAAETRAVQQHYEARIELPSRTAPNSVV